MKNISHWLNLGSGSNLFFIPQNYDNHACVTGMVIVGIVGSILALSHHKGTLFLIYSSALALISIGMSVYVLGNNGLEWPLVTLLFEKYPEINSDQMSAYFSVITTLVVWVASYYAVKYISNRESTHSQNIYYIPALMLQISMLLLVWTYNLVLLLVLWEIMSLSSFMMMLLHNRSKEVTEAALEYLVHMHVCFVILLVGVIWLVGSTGKYDFSAFGDYFASKSNGPMALLFFVGFGIKAGFIPLHSWVPNTYSTAPAPCAAVMAGAIKKVSLLMILRILMYMQDSFYEFGMFVLVISVITALYGIIQASVQHEMKRLLAYRSIENVGIIGISMALGLIGKGVFNASMAYMGFAAALIHIANHSLFKTVLYLSSGELERHTGTTMLDKLGGVIKSHPHTSVFVLVGVLAATGLPPLNGFVSEFLIYNGIIGEFSKGTVSIDVLLLVSLLCLSLIGGVSVFTYSKLVGIVLLGNPRVMNDENSNELENRYLWIPFGLLMGCMLLISIFPAQLVSFLSETVSLFVPLSFNISIGSIHTLGALTQIVWVFVALVAALFMLRKWATSHKPVTVVPTWDCGYTAPHVGMQYTASSFSESVEQLASPLFHFKTRFKPLGENEIFPKARRFKSDTHDLISYYLIQRPIWRLRHYVQRLAFVQTGITQNYVLYSFVFLLILFLLTFFNIL